MRVSTHGTARDYEGLVYTAVGQWVAPIQGRCEALVRDNAM